jgi:hypothetical protein
MALQIMETPNETLDFYARPATLTSAGRHAHQFDELPREVAALARVVQGLTLHRYMAAAYGVAISSDRRGEDHLRPVGQMIERVLAIDARPLTASRPPEERLVGVCRHFAVFLVSMLRAQGVPARARVGFGSYFNPGYFEDHWVCEYWNAPEARWMIADPQFDEVWRTNLKIKHDVLDVPRDRFLVASDAWVQCRTRKADPSKFGIFEGNLRGLWFIAGDLVRDVAALNKMEMLAWDVWGAMPRPGEALSDDQLAFFDRLAELTHQPGESFDELRKLYEGDSSLRVPGTVFNAVLNRQETV